MSEQIEGRNAVLEAFRSGKCVDKLFVLDRCQDRAGAHHYKRSKKKRYDYKFCTEGAAGAG